MALIKCPECNDMVSNKADICPHCGFSIQKYIESADEIIVCPKCGSSEDYHSNGICCICNSKVVNTHKLFSYKYEDRLTRTKKKNEAFEELKDMGLYDPKFYKMQQMIYNGTYSLNATDEELALKDEYNAKLIEIRTRDGFYEERNRREKELSAPQKITIKCPNCGSTDTKRVTAISRMAGVLTLGLASSSIGKQYMCKRCKYKW